MTKELARRIYRILPYCVIMDGALFTHGGIPIDEKEDLYTARVPGYNTKPSFVWGRTRFNSEVSDATSSIGELYYTNDELNAWCTKNAIKAAFRTSEKSPSAFVDDFGEGNNCGHYTLSSRHGGMYAIVDMGSYDGTIDSVVVKTI
eukprot:gnl/Chilomastix_caulleri/1633.p2 GENE.gnl/Chilomastix_caulleri/1633~~gnl/Chilomastix_caulleri/1633.p2  ORF type:complete len:146 (+),score=37.01 gnl/Chilomastix_caulleri/1633:145-582(+)